jgi:hypothetical protein
MRNFKVTSGMGISEGMHNGRIVRVEYKDEPYAYCDIIILVESSGVESTEGIELKYGMPQNISIKDGIPSTKFAKILESFGRKITLNEDIAEEEIEKIFVGKYVKFITVNELVKLKDGRTGEFARIVDNSIKLVSQ